jgi:hypothetical protein
MVRTVEHSTESSDDIDQFYLRGGLKDMIEKYYTLAELDPITVGTADEPVTISRMLPRKIVADVVGDALKQVAYVKGDLKYFSDSVQAYLAPVPEEVQQLVSAGRKLLNQRTIKTQHTDEAVDLEDVSVTYEDGVLQIGEVEILVRSFTLEDAVLDYLINHFEPDEWVHKDRIVNWVIDELEDESKNAKSVYDKVVAINNKVREAVGTESLLFDTSRSGYIKRNY